MEKMRKPFQGVWNIVRFNRQYYFIAAALIIALLLLRNELNTTFFIIAAILVVAATVATLISLSVSCYVYDFSNLYTLAWLDTAHLQESGMMVNINAGFDETSELLVRKFPQAEWRVFDFFDASRHTEISIKRARKAYPPFPGTQQVETGHLPLPDHSVVNVFALLSAHEIRKDDERLAFFRELNRILQPEGKIIITEHLRDAANFFAYTIGFFHFHPKAKWCAAFAATGFIIEKELKVTPFITTFILRKNGAAS